MNIEIIPNDNVKEREDKHGHVRISHRRTWMLIVDGILHDEYHTRREAKVVEEKLRSGTAPSSTRPRKSQHAD